MAGVALDLHTLQQRALAGDPRAQGEWGARLLVGREAPFQPDQGRRLFDAALARNDPWALQFAAVLAALGQGRPQSWSEAHELVSRAAALGDTRAQGQLAVLGHPFDVAAWLAPPPPQQRFAAPRVSTIEGFLAPAACAWIMEQARPRLEAARVKNPERGGANADSYRSNTGMGFSVIDSDLVLQLTHARIAKAIGVPVMQQEPTNILHYTVGQEYRPHFDYLDPGVAHFARELQQIGQRIVTFLIYLNEDYDGGETSFPRLDWSFKGKTGDALVFWNVTPEGRPDAQTLHTGSAPTRGEKWLFSKWVRSKELPLI